jgi:hypothetical protein
MNTGNDFDLASSTNADVFAAHYIDNVAYIEVFNGKTIDGAARSLQPSTTYAVTLTQAVLSDGSVLTSAPRYFKTPATDAEPTTLVDYTGSGTAKIAVAEEQVIEITFSAPVQLQPVGTVVLERYVNADYSDAEPTTFEIDADFATYAYGTTQDKVVVTFNQSFVADRYYRIVNNDGGWFDQNGVPVEDEEEIKFATEAQ